MAKMIALRDFLYSPDGFRVVEIKEGETFDCRDDVEEGLLVCGAIEHLEEHADDAGAEPLEPEDEQPEEPAAATPIEAASAPEAPLAAPEEAPAEAAKKTTKKA